MLPIVFQIPHTPVRIFGFGLMMVVALWSSLELAARRAKKVGLNPEMVADMAFWVIVFGLIGARAFYVTEYWGSKEMRTFWDVLAVWNGGIVFYGSILGGLLGFILYYKLRPFPLLPTLDVIAPSLAVGVAFGRIGCFLNGCCFGDRCSLPWGVTFPKGSIPWNVQLDQRMIAESAARSLRLHPTQLYSAFDGFLLLWLLSTFYPLRRRDGEVMALLMITYPISRFLIELLRDDESVFVGGLTIAQAISVGILTAGVGFWAWLQRRPARLYQDQKPSAADGV